MAGTHESPWAPSPPCGSAEGAGPGPVHAGAPGRWERTGPASPPSHREGPQSRQRLALASDSRVTLLTARTGRRGSGVGEGRRAGGSALRGAPREPASPCCGRLGRRVGARAGRTASVRACVSATCVRVQVCVRATSVHAYVRACVCVLRGKPARLPPRLDLQLRGRGPPISPVSPPPPPPSPAPPSRAAVSTWADWCQVSCFRW